MSIEYKVSPDGLRIEAFPTGALDTKSTIDYFEKLKYDKKIKQNAIEIVYFKDVTDFKFSYLDGNMITESYQEPKALQLIEATIFVCETSLEYGIGRMLQTFHEITNPDHKVMVVHSESELNESLKGMTSPT
jgi:hypothetical protein